MTLRPCLMIALLAVVSAAHFRSGKMPPRRAVKHTQEDAAAAFTKEVGLKARWAAERLAKRFAPMKAFSAQGQRKRRDNENDNQASETLSFHLASGARPLAFGNLDTNDDKCINASEWAAADPTETPPGLFGYIAGFSTHDNTCTDHEISEADFQTWSSPAGGGPSTVPCTPTRGCLTIVAANEGPLSIADASLERRTFDMSAMSMDDSSSQTDQTMTILTFEVRFNSSIALHFQLPSEDVLRYAVSNFGKSEYFPPRYSVGAVDEIVAVLSGWNETDKSFEEIKNLVDNSNTLPNANDFLFDFLLQILPFDVRLQCDMSDGERRDGSQDSQGLPAFADVDKSHDGCISKNEFDESISHQGQRREGSPVFEILAGLSILDGNCTANEISPADFQAFFSASSSGSQGPPGQDTNDVPTVPFYVIPPTDNAVPSFLYKMMVSESKGELFRNLTWHNDTFFVVVPVVPGMPGGPKFEEESCRMLVGGMPAQKFTDTSSDCTVQELLEFGELVAPFLSSLEDQASSIEDFFSQTMVLSIVKMMDGFERCKYMLESMITTSEMMVWAPGQRACQKDWGTNDWKIDPCCNPEKAFEMCCGLSPQMQGIKIIDSIEPSDKCDTESGGFQLNNALLSYSTVDRLRNDPVMGCTAARKQKFDEKSLTRLFKFVDICYDRVYKGKTKAGLETCNQDSECYTSCDVEQQKCVVPYAGPEKAFLQCGLDNMDPTLLGWLRKNHGVSSFDRGNALERALQSKYAENRCIGPDQNSGVCLLNFEEADCNKFNKNVFDPSKADALKESPFPLRRERFEYVDGELIEILISTTWMPDAPGGSGACRVDSFNLWEYSCDFPCTLGEESPSFYPYSNPSLICSKIAKALANVSDVSVIAATGTYISFDPQYDYRYDTATGTYGRVKISDGSEFWCEHEQTCNHMSPWDADAGNETKCVDDYEEGGTKVMLGSSFCAKCEGPYCSEISSPAVCRYSQIYDEGSCNVEGGIWLDNGYGWGDCRVDLPPDHNESSCFGESFKYCPKEIYSYEWGDTIWSYTSYGFCEYMSVCHAPDVTQADCEYMNAGGDDFPMFIGKSIASGFSGGFSGRRHHPSDPEGSSLRNTKTAKSLTAQTLLRKVLSMHIDKRGPAHTHAHALAALRRGAMHTRGSEEPACTTDREWEDSDGDACGDYEANPEWCYEAELYSDVDGHDAKGKCCFCRGLTSAVNNSACTDDADWVDIDGDSCESYYNLDPFNNCPDAYVYADASGQDASTKCCSCKISEEFTEVYTPDFAYPVVDEDGDGCLSEADFNRLVESLNLDDVLNATQVGSPTFETIRAWEYEYDSSNANGITCLSQQTFDLVAMITSSFASFDNDKSWCLSLAEFSSIFEDDGSNSEEVESEFNNVTDSSDDDSCLGNISIRDVYVYFKDAEQLDSQEQYTQDQGSFLPFSPKESMCVLWADTWGGWTGGADWNSKSNCENAGYTWMAPRAFSEGKWNTEQSCQGGVCSSSPWDWELAKTPDKCAAVGGRCSKQCITCDSAADVPDICIAQSIMNESNCQEQDLQWSQERQKCYGTRDKNFMCFDRPDKRIISCLDVQVGNKGCAKDGWRDDELYNGTFLSPDLPSGLSCFTNYYGVCSKETCQDGGSCNDWTYANWGAESEDTSSCRIPFTQGADWGGPNTTTCYDLQSQYPGTTANAWMDDACILNNMKTSDCTANGGTPVSRADTEAQCTRFKGCFDTNYNTITAVGESECKNEDICDSDRFQWNNVLEWTPGVWSLSKMTSAGIKWSERRMQRKNTWSKVVPWDTLQNEVYKAAFAMAAEAYVAEFKCAMEPFKAILATVACTCGLDKDENEISSVCDAIMEEIKPSFLTSKTVFLSGGNEHTLAQPGFGSVNFDRQDVKKSLAVGDDSLQVEMLYTNAIDVAGSSDRRQITSTSTTCEQFEVIKNAQDQVIGQLAGNGLVVKGLKNAIVTICVPASEAIPYCSSLVKYSVPDFALGNVTTARPGAPLKNAVSIDKSNQFCGDVRLGDEGQIMLYPVLRTDNMQPAGKIGADAGVEDTMTLSGTATIKNKNHFSGDLAMMAAFRNSVASALASVSADLAAIAKNSIVILKVCDAEDSSLALCIDLSAKTVTRSRNNAVTPSSIRVVYLIQPESASGAPITDGLVKIRSALQKDGYASKFKALFAAQGYVITVVVPPVPPKPLEVAPVAPANSPFAIILVISMPYTVAQFDKDKQDKFKQALAIAAATSPLNIDIVSINEARRRAGSVAVETKIRAKDAASLKTLESAVGSGDNLMNNLNRELKKQGLAESSGVVIKSSVQTKELEAESKGLSGGAIAGIVIGSLVGTAILVFGSYYLVKMHTGSKELTVAGEGPEDAGQGIHNVSSTLPNSPPTPTRTDLTSRTKEDQGAINRNAARSL